MRLEPYLIFNGNCEEAFKFYQSVFGGEFERKVYFKDMPGFVPEKGEENKLMHISLPIYSGMTLMGSDSPNKMGAPNPGDNINLSIAVDSEAQAKKLFEGLSAGGKVSMPLMKTEWAALYGMWRDKYGIDWMLNYTTGSEMM